MNKKLVIIGAGGHGKVCADIAERIGKYSEIFFLDDGENKTCLGYPVVGRSDDAEKFVLDCDFFVAIGNAKVRRELLNQIESVGGRVATLIHPNAVIGREVKMGEGTVVMAGAVINPSVEIGRGVIINTCASVDHDSVVGDYCHVAVGVRIAGTVKIGENCFFGAGAVSKNNVDICADCIFGAGAVIVKNVREKGTYVGVPARKKN